MNSSTPTQSRTPSSPELVPQIFLFDWDDTLFPTTVFVHRKSFNRACFMFRRLVSHVLRLLEICNSLGDVVIVTNSKNGWAHYTASHYMPEILDYITTNDIPVVSARGNYQALHPREPVVWKRLTFTEEIQKVLIRRGNVRKAHVIAMGDSKIDINAAVESRQILQNKDINIVLSTIKFEGRPSLQRLKSELGKCIEMVAEICASKNDERYAFVFLRWRQSRFPWRQHRLLILQRL